MERIVTEVLQALDTVERCLKAQLVVYDFSRTLTSYLPADKITHRSPFCCAMIQMDLGHKCGAFDCTAEVPSVLRKGQAGFYKHCHGNVLEYVHGLYRNDELLGAVIAGPFRWSRHLAIPEPALRARAFTSLNSKLEGLYAELSGISPEMLRDIPVVLSMLASHLVSIIPPLKEISRRDQNRRWIIEDFLARRFRYEETALCDLAKLLGLSEERTRHVVMELYKQSFVDLLTGRRINHAKNLLASTNMTVTQLVEYCGYSDSHHFHRIFRKNTGMTPLQYRRQAADSPSAVV